MLHVSFAVTLYKKKNIVEFKVRKGGEGGRGGEGRGRILVLSVIRSSSDSFTSRILYHMTLNITSLGSTLGVGNPPLPLSHT